MYTHPEKMYTHQTTSRDLAAPCLCAFHSAISIETVMANTQKLGPHRPPLALNKTLQKKGERFRMSEAILKAER